MGSEMCIRDRQKSESSNAKSSSVAKGNEDARKCVAASNGNCAAHDDADNDCASTHRRDDQWANMFDVRVSSTQPRLTEPEANIKIAARIAAECLRQHVTCPPMLDNAEASWTDARGHRWPRITCACKSCVFRSEGTDISGVVDKDGDSEYRDHPEHPWDQELRLHILEEPAEAFQAIVKSILGQATSDDMLWDYYKEACAVQERKQFPIVGFSTERRTMEHVAHIYNDERIHSYVCFACAQIAHLVNLTVLNMLLRQYVIFLG